MLVKSSIFTQMSGKYDGAVAMDGRAGQAVRSHVIPANPKTEAQLQVRQALRLVVAQFFSPALSRVERDAWAAYAGDKSLPRRLGGSYRPTAQQAFVTVNAIRAQLGLGIQTTPPPRGKVVIGATIAWQGEELVVQYPLPEDGGPDALALGGGLRLYAARRPIFHARRYGPWDGTATLLGADPRPVGRLAVAVGASAAEDKVFYRLVGSTDAGQPMAVMEGVVMGV